MAVTRQSGNDKQLSKLDYAYFDDSVKLKPDYAWAIAHLAHFKSVKMATGQPLIKFTVKLLTYNK